MTYAGPGPCVRCGRIARATLCASCAYGVAVAAERDREQDRNRRIAAWRELREAS